MYEAVWEPQTFGRLSRLRKSAWIWEIHERYSIREKFDIPGVLLMAVPVEKTRMLLFLWRIKNKTNTLFRTPILTEIQPLNPQMQWLWRT
jgi:hypothetical protein